jgi:Mn2+/Fe2+ NRAMP family transporter
LSLFLDLGPLALGAFSPRNADRSSSYWSAVINGVLAPPIMVVLMLLVRKERVMGKLIVEGWLYWLGWIATAAMALSIVGMAFSLAAP